MASERWLGKTEQSDRWKILVETGLRWQVRGEFYEQTTATESHRSIQGEGGLGCVEG
jgi:hypothetical protein